MAMKSQKETTEHKNGEKMVKKKRWSKSVVGDE